MKQCRLCHSYAINTHLGERKGKDYHKDLCDVCFWKVQVEELSEAHAVLLAKYKKTRAQLTTAMTLGNLTIKGIKDATS